MDSCIKCFVILCLAFGKGLSNLIDDCDASMTSSSVADCQPSPHDAPNYAVIPYNSGGILSQFYESTKAFVVPGVDRSIVIKQDWANNGVAGVVWEAARILSEYISHNIEMEDAHVLELGAGTGLVGMTAAALGANVTCTDLAKALPLLQQNIDLNFSPTEREHRLKVRRLEWGVDLEDFDNSSYDYIVGADIIYLEDSFDVLVETLRYFSTNKKNTKFYLSGKLRYNRVENFLKKLKISFANVKKVHEDKVVNVVIYECF